MWTFKKLFGQEAPMAARLTGASALGCLTVGTYNLILAEAPHAISLAYRIGVVLIGLGLLAAALWLADRSH